MSEERLAGCNLCDCLCGLVLTVDGGRVSKVRGDVDDPFSRGHVCSKAVALRDLHEDPDRLRTPLVRDGDGFRTAGWDEALDVAVAGLTRVQRAHGRHAVAVYTGNPVVHSHRALFAAGLIPAALGTRNRFDANSQDGNPRLFACMQVYGDALDHPTPDLPRLDLLLMFGANPAVSHGSQLGLGDPKKRFAEMRDRGGRIVLFDPRRSEMAEWATEHHFIRPGADAAVLAAMLHVIFAENLEARDLERFARGESTLRWSVEAFSPEAVERPSAVPADVTRALARDFARTENACVYARVGVCQNTFGPLASYLVEALNVVCGKVDRPGGALFPSPAADLAPLGRIAIGNRWGRFRSRVRNLPEFLGALPSAALAEEIETDGPGRIRGLVVHAGNPVLSIPNGERLARALPTLDHMVAIDFYVNDTTRNAHVILPPVHVFETGNYDLALNRFAIHTVARWNEPVLPMPSDGRDDWQIALELALRLRAPRPLRGPLRRVLSRLPEAAIDWMLRLGPHRLSRRKLRLHLHGLDLGPPTPRGFLGRGRDRRANLAPDVLIGDFSRLVGWLGETRPTLVLIGRRHVRSDNSWLHNLPSMTKGPDRSHLWMHGADATARELHDGDLVIARSRTGAVEVSLRVCDDLMPGVVSLPHGFGHRAAQLRVASALPGGNVNALTDELLIEPLIGTSILNGVPVEVVGASRLRSPRADRGST